MPIVRNGVAWEPGAIVYVKWFADSPPGKRVIIRMGKAFRRVFVVSYRLEEPQCRKDEIVIACTIGELVLFFFFLF